MSLKLTQGARVDKPLTARERETGTGKEVAMITSFWLRLNEIDFKVFEKGLIDFIIKMRGFLQVFPPHPIQFTHKTTKKKQFYFEHWDPDKMEIMCAQTFVPSTHLYPPPSTPHTVNLTHRTEKTAHVF